MFYLLTWLVATKTKIPHKGKSGIGTSCKVQTSKSTPSIIQVNVNTCYLCKGDSIKVDGHQYFAHSTNISYWIGEHDVAGMEYVLVDCGANGIVCGDGMLVFEGSEHFADISGLAGHKAIQLCFATAHVIVTIGANIINCSCSCSLPGGKQRALVEVYQLPLNFKNGLPYL
jgi:hypothetical protein